MWYVRVGPYILGQVYMYMHVHAAHVHVHVCVCVYVCALECGASNFPASKQTKFPSHEIALAHILSSLLAQEVIVGSVKCLWFLRYSKQRGNDAERASLTDLHPSILNCPFPLIHRFKVNISERTSEGRYVS